MLVEIEIPGEATPFARAGAHGKRRFTPTKQANAMAVARLFAEQAMAGKELFEGPLLLQVGAFYVAPASWSAKKKQETGWKSSKPDIDNVVKLLKDAFNGVVWHDDAQVSKIEAHKRYADKACVRIIISNLQQPL